MMKKVYGACGQAAVCIILFHGVRMYAKQSWPRKRGDSSGTLEPLQFLARGLELDLDKNLSLSEDVNHWKVRKKPQIYNK